METWEHLFVVADKSRDDLRPHYQNGKQLDDWKNRPNLFEYANKLGNQGWDLVAAPHRHALIFKRRKMVETETE